MSKFTAKDGDLVRCPCCRSEFETADHVPFSREEFDLHGTAPDLLAACKALLLLRLVHSHRVVAEKIGPDAEAALARGGAPALGRYVIDLAEAAIAKAERGAA